jgi:hypothetical protein
LVNFFNYYVAAVLYCLKLYDPAKNTITGPFRTQKEVFKGLRVRFLGGKSPQYKKIKIILSSPKFITDNRREVYEESHFIFGYHVAFGMCRGATNQKSQNYKIEFTPATSH